MPRHNVKLWSHKIVLCLIELYADEELQNNVKFNPGADIWGSIATDLTTAATRFTDTANGGLVFTAKQCKNKIKNLKTDYRQARKYQDTFLASILVCHLRSGSAGK